jgi:hypothetical protein
MHVTSIPSRWMRRPPLVARGSSSDLRVILVPEFGRPQDGSGRMLISGRMRDVCAELDRLVQHEETRLALRQAASPRPWNRVAG